MSEYDELVKRLRDVETRERILGFGGSETLLLFSKEAADAIEALVGEVAGLKHDIARHVQVATDLASEVERLKGALHSITLSYDERCGIDHATLARSALEAKP